LLVPCKTSSWKITPCWLSATAYSVYYSSWMLSPSSAYHAMVTRNLLNMAVDYIGELHIASFP